MRLLHPVIPGLFHTVCTRALDRYCNRFHTESTVLVILVFPSLPPSPDLKQDLSLTSLHAVRMVKNHPDVTQLMGNPAQFASKREANNHILPTLPLSLGGIMLIVHTIQLFSFFPTG